MWKSTSVESPQEINIDSIDSTDNEIIKKSNKNIFDSVGGINFQEWNHHKN